MSMTLARERAPARTERLGYRPELDAIRGIAVVSVLLTHSSMFFREIPWADLYSGFFGVDVFFVLSGFLITTLLLEEREAAGSISLARFYARRALRLFPALLFAVLLAAVCVSLLGTKAPGMPVGSAAVYVFALVANWSGSSLGLLSHTWSLGVEEQYYLIWPVVLIVCLRRRVSHTRLAAGLLAGAIVVAVARAIVVHGGGPTDLVWGVLRADGVMIGSALGAVVNLRDASVTRFLADRRTRWGAAMVVVAYLAYVEIGGHIGRHGVTKDLLVVGSLAAAVVLGSIVVRPAGALNAPRLTSLGRLSYSLYLVHYPIFGTLAGADVHPIAAAVVAWGLTFIVANVSYHLVEQPALRLKRFFSEPSYLIAKAFGGDATPAFRFSGAEVNRNS